MPDGSSTELLEALLPLLARIGGTVVDGPPDVQDVAVVWRGEPAFHIRLPADTGSRGDDATGPTRGAGPLEGTDLTDGLARLIAEVETELGGALAELPRAQKQHAVRLLEERGAFEMRRSAETVAEALGLTRFTVYNYLNRIREADGPRS